MQLLTSLFFKPSLGLVTALGRLCTRQGEKSQLTEFTKGQVEWRPLKANEVFPFTSEGFGVLSTSQKCQNDRVFNQTG